MTVQSNAFEREDRHLVTDADLERPGTKRTRPDGNLALIALAVGHQPVQVIQKYPTSASWPGLTRPSTPRQRHLRAISIIALIAWFRVLVDGRVKPGHDEKPEKQTMRGGQQQLTL
jgi:hypothetical protein